MKGLRVIILVAATLALYTPASASCRVTELKLEKAILPHSELRQSANRQIVRDLRTLREAAIILDAKSIRPNVSVWLQWVAIWSLTRTARLRRQEILTRTRPRSCTRRAAARQPPTPPSSPSRGHTTLIGFANDPSALDPIAGCGSIVSGPAPANRIGRFTIALGATHDPNDNRRGDLAPQGS